MSALLIGTELNITAGGTDSVTVRANVTSGLVEVLDQNGLLASMPSVSASAIQALTITGGDNTNVIDLSGVTAAVFTALTSIQVSGGNGNDRITGSPDLANSLNGGDGSDVLLGGSVNDTLNGGNGADAITGGLGNDSLLGGDGADTLSGDAGLDTLEGGNGADLLSAGDDNDSVNGGNGADNIDGGLGNDTLNGDGGSDTITGGADNDTIYGGAENDSLLGGSGNDSVLAQAGNDTVDGEAGFDTLFGGDGADSVSGGADDDTLNGGAGDDTLFGDRGSDKLLGGAENDQLFAGGTNVFDLAADSDTLLGQSGNDTLQGDGGSDLLDGGAGDDVLKSGDIDSQNSVLISISDAVAVVEGDSGTVIATFTVTLSGASASVITVDYATADGSATSASLDYTSIPTTTLTFNPTVTTQTISVTVLSDLLNEDDENFFVNLSNPNGAYLSDTQAQGVITDDDGWQAQGPAPIQVNANTQFDGGIQAIALHPSIPDIAYIGAINGGIWRTTNATAASPDWTSVSDFKSSLSIGALEFDPTDPNRQTLVAGIGSLSSLGGGASGRETGLILTTDGGTTWKELNSPTLQNQTITSVAARGNILMAASDNTYSMTFSSTSRGDGLFRSTDSGTTFTNISDGALNHLPLNMSVSDLVGDPGNTSIFYAAVPDRGIFRSTDTGVLWTAVTNNIPANIINNSVKIELAVLTGFGVAEAD